MTQDEARRALYSRLWNFKFAQALEWLGQAGLNDDEQQMVRCLAASFGNCGWFEGDLATIIKAALRNLPEYDTISGE